MVNGSLCSRNVVFAENATSGVGGQGEFLRQMVYGLEGVSGAQVFSRQSRSEIVKCVDVPFDGWPEKPLSVGIKATPLLRGRLDLLTLLSDLEFDSSVSHAINEPSIFDGIAGQCATSMAKLGKSQSVRVLTSLNTHVDYLSSALSKEHESLGIREPHYVHPRMRLRMLRETTMADVIRVPSSFARETFVNAGVPAGKIAVVPIGIDLRHFRRSPKCDDVFRILAVSSFDARKGIVYLLEAYKDLNISHSELMLIGASGSRWARKVLSGYARRFVSLRLAQVDVTTEPVTKSYGMASVLVHPAIEDGFGLVIPQALACGIPVIATRTSGASELIAHGETGFVVDPRRPDMIREYLQVLATDKRLREQMGVRASESMQKQGYDTFARRLRDFYAAVPSTRLTA